MLRALVRGGMTTEGRVPTGITVVGVLAVVAIFFSNLLIRNEASAISSL
jgi:hypothetical protein